MTSNKEERALTSIPGAEGKVADCVSSRQEEEEKVLLTAWQNMLLNKFPTSWALQQHSLCEPSRASGLAQSFLSEQRQSSQARRALGPRLRAQVGASIHSGN